MECATLKFRRHGWLLALAAIVACGCQTVRTPEEAIAKSNLPKEFTKVTMPEYVLEPPDLIIVEVLEALPGRPISGERLVKPDGKITLGFYGEVFVAGLTTDEVKEKIVLHLRKFLPDEVLGLNEIDPEDGSVHQKEPRDSDRVFVDVVAYNSKFYYVAINYAGGLIPTASSSNIRLVRPAPPGACCEQVLPVNLSAIISAGDPTTNYQIMPNDRIVVYRDGLVRATLFMDKVLAPVQTLLQTGMQFGFAYRTLKYINQPLFGGGAAAGGTGTARGAGNILPSQTGAR
jgi:polysaccharide biosynthesis/export protein